MGIDQREYMIERYLKREGIRPHNRRLTALKKAVIFILIINVCLWASIFYKQFVM